MSPVRTETEPVYRRDARVHHAPVEDALLVELAKAAGIVNLCFLGVASSSEDSNMLFTEYSKHGADAVVTDVNDVPYLFTKLEGV